MILVANREAPRDPTKASKEPRGALFSFSHPPGDRLVLISPSLLLARCCSRSETLLSFNSFSHFLFYSSMHAMGAAASFSTSFFGVSVVIAGTSERGHVLFLHTLAIIIQTSMMRWLYTPEKSCGRSREPDAELIRCADTAAVQSFHRFKSHCPL